MSEDNHFYGEYETGKEDWETDVWWKHPWDRLYFHGDVIEHRLEGEAM